MFEYNEYYLNNKRIFISGNERILQKKKIGIFVSRAMPLNIIVPAEEFLLHLSESKYLSVPFSLLTFDICITFGHLAPFPFFSTQFFNIFFICAILLLKKTGNEMTENAFGYNMLKTWFIHALIIKEGL